MAKHPSLTIAVVAIVGVAITFALARTSVHSLVIKCYFQDAQGLHAHAPVRLAGVDVGTVSSVRVVPEKRDHPAEVVMILQTPYELKVPNDAVVSPESAGVLGQTFVQIDIQSATGPPIQSGGELKTRASESPTPQQWVDCFSNMADHKPCDLHRKDDKANQTTVASPTK